MYQSQKVIKKYKPKYNQPLNKNQTRVLIKKISIKKDLTTKYQQQKYEP